MLQAAHDTCPQLHPWQACQPAQPQSGWNAVLPFAPTCGAKGLDGKELALLHLGGLAALQRACVQWVSGHDQQHAVVVPSMVQ